MLRSEGCLNRDPADFATWQPRYAAHGVALFSIEVRPDAKKPAIRGWKNVGIRGAEQLALKFASAAAFGFLCGARNRLTIVDLDDTDPAIVGEGARLFGPY